MPDASEKMSFWEVFKTTFSEWSNHHASRLAAAVAYYATFSIAPLLMIAIALLGLVYGSAAASDQLRPQLVKMLGDKPAEFIQDLVKHAGYSPSLSFAGILSIILILYAAANLFVALQDSLNTIFGVEVKPGRGIKDIIADRALSFLMVLIVGVLILASVLLSTFLTAIATALPSDSIWSSYLPQVFTFLGTFLLFTGIFAALFKFLPDVKIDWHDTLIGAAATSLVFSLARIALGFYLGRSSTTGPFGAAGSLVVILLFIYYSTQVLFLGAEFTQVWARRDGQPIKPADNAKCIEDTPARQGSTGASAADCPESPSPHYPATQFRPPVYSAPSRAPVIASVAALAALPLTLLLRRRR